MRRLITVIASMLAVIAALAAAPAPTPVDFVAVATEPCEAGPDLSGRASPDWEDLCEVAFASVSPDGQATTLAVRLTAVGSIEDRPVQMVYLTRWEAGDCSFELRHRDADGEGTGEDLLRAVCAFVEGECDTVGLVSLCETDTVGFDLEAEVTPPTIEGDTLTWQITFDGDLAPLAEIHAAGAVLTPTRTIAGLGMRTNAGPVHHSWRPGSGGVSCIGDDCFGDWFEVVDADRTFTIR